MANETTATTVTGLIHASFISKVMLNYALDANVFLPRARYEQVTPGSGTAAFAVATKGSAGAITDGTGLSNTALTFANTTATASEVGILRHVTKKAARFNMMGDAGLHAWAVEDGRRLCLEKMETDGLAVATNASTSVGTSGANLTIGNMAGAISQASINKAPNRSMYFILSTFQARDLRAAIASSSAPIVQHVGGGEILNGPDAAGFTGTFMGKAVFETNLAVAASADKVGFLAVDGMTDPSHAPVGCALGWMPEPEMVDTPQMPGKQIAVTACYGFAEILDYAYVKIVTIGS
jgi:hypothetical protein